MCVFPRFYPQLLRDVTAFFSLSVKKYTTNSISPNRFIYCVIFICICSRMVRFLVSPLSSGRNNTPTARRWFDEYEMERNSQLHLIT